MTLQITVNKNIYVMSHLLMYINWFYLQLVIRVFLAFLACICSDTGASVGAIVTI